MLAGSGVVVFAGQVWIGAGAGGFAGAGPGISRGWCTGADSQLVRGGLRGGPGE